MVRKLNDDVLGVLQPNVIENDMLYVSSVLREISKMIGKTYGPYSGFVAYTHKDTGLAYTKDGMSTLLKMTFNHSFDNIILHSVREIGFKIKSTSGDGSTTAAKVLSNMVTRAAEDLLVEDKDKTYKYRITTPKAIEKIIKILKSTYREDTFQVESTKDILDAAFIAVNNDESLMGPFKKICEFIDENNIVIDEDLDIGVFRGLSDETSVDINPGMELGTHSFVAHPQGIELQNCRIILINNAITMDFNYYILNALISFSNTYFNATNERLIFVVPGMDREGKEELRKTMNSFATKKKLLPLDFVILPFDIDFSANRREDLSLFLNTNAINLYEYVEKRREIVDPEVDNINNTNLMKFRVSVDNEGKLVDPNIGISSFIDRINKEIEGSILCNVRYINAVGITITPVKYEKTKNPAFESHLKELKALANDVTKGDASEIARRRLYYLKDKYFAINVGKRLSDNDRLLPAYRDAANAVTSMAKMGYHMGGSIGALKMLARIGKVLEEEKADDTSQYLVKLLYESFADLIPELNIERLPVNECIDNGIIDIDKMTFYDTRVIGPVMTDYVIIENILSNFSNIYSSLLIETSSPEETFHIRKVTGEIKENIEDIENNNKVRNTKENSNGGVKGKAIIKSMQYVDENNEVVADVSKEVKEVQKANGRIDEELPKDEIDEGLEELLTRKAIEIIKENNHKIDLEEAVKLAQKELLDNK